MNIQDFARDIAPEISRQIRDGTREANEKLIESGSSARLKIPGQFEAEFFVRGQKILVPFPVFPA